MLLFLVIVGISIALLLGAIWALYVPLPDRLEGFAVALSGGALLIAAVLELIEPVIQEQASAGAFIAILAGGVLYTGLIYALEQSSRADEAAGTGATMLLNGVPENVAVGIALIGPGATQAIALVGAIFLANVPEAAGATKSMVARGYATRQIAILWLVIVTALAVSTLVGHYGIAQTNLRVIGYLRCFTAGAIITSLAVDVFPKAFTADHRLSGVATVLGVIVALALNRIG